MLEKELEAAIRLARQAGKLILDFYASEIVAEEKYGIDNLTEPVTIADRMASKLIVEQLSREFPGDAILSEEESDDKKNRLARKRVWIIDPLDGTRGFINKDGDFGVQIGLAENGAAIGGAVYLPIGDRLFYAARNGGAFLVENGGEPRRLKTADTANINQMKIAVSRNHLSPKMAEILKKMRIENVVKRGSVGLKVGLIAEKTCDLYIHLSPRTKFWDTCAPQIILEEAGGELTDLFGEKIDYAAANVQNLNGVCASNGAAHEQIVEDLKPLLIRFGRLRLKRKTTGE